MSKETEIMSSVANMVSYIKDKIRLDLVEAVNQGIIDIDRNKLDKTCNFINASIESSFSSVSSEVINTLRSQK
tara:strand:- start:2156 stop:2374 length:219 start_codon:yes stop_codon:yes gene_type:complete